MKRKFVFGGPLAMGLILTLVATTVVAPPAAAQRSRPRRESRQAEEASATPVPAATEALTPIALALDAPTTGSAAARKTKPLDEKSTLTLNLNNVSIDQLVKFLSDSTGKPVLKQKDIQQTVTITSPRPVTLRRALDLIYDALLIEKIYVLEGPDKIQILKAENIQNLNLETIGADGDLQKRPDSLQVAQKIYKLQNIKPDTLKTLLTKIVPESALNIDPASGTVMITDQISRLKNYDRIIASLEGADVTDRTIEIYRLQYADAIDMATLLGSILTETATLADGTSAGQRQALMVGAMRSSSHGRTRGTMPIMSGEIVIVPDPRMNWLIVSCPKAKVAEVKRLVAEFDILPDQDVKTRLIDLKYIDAQSVASLVRDLFDDRQAKSEKETIQAVPTSDGLRLAVLSSQANYEMISTLVKEIDTENAEQRETRTYKINHLEAQDLADQLTDLFEMKNPFGNSGYGSYYSIHWNGSGNNSSQPSFVPSPRTNSLVVMARSRDFEFIEQMIKELDVSIDSQTFEPHIYRIRHTDANELVRVLESLFTERSGRSSGYYDYWRPASNTKDSLAAQFGKIRFVVDSITNTVVALSSNPQNYEIIDGLIQKLDQDDPEATQVMIYQLKYADPVDVANHINNMFSEGPVQQPQQQQQQQQQQQGNQQNSSTYTPSLAANRSTQRTKPAVFWWQSGQQSRSGQSEERPINTMIGNVRVVPDTRSNQISVAAAPIYFDALKFIVESLDQQEPQVNIATRMVEIQRGDERRIGIRWTPDPNQIDPAELDNALLGLGELGFLDTYGKGTPFDTTQPFGSTQTNPGNTILSADINLALLVQLLMKNTDSRIVAEPSLVVNNNETGELFVGSQYPFQTNVQRTPEGTTNFDIERQPVGITLDITPHINNKREIVLTVALINST
ncbi:MAG: hypothetical protein M1457_00165, partial [bacterium]|nr:hypothetical protein [bacterium]